MIPANPDEHRQQLIENVTYDFLSRRERGETLAAGEFAGEYPELMPDLIAALEAGLRRLRQAREANHVDVGVPSDPTAPYRPALRGYQFRREISRGGQGVVFEAVQESTGRIVAIKIVTGVSRSSVTRFEREVQALASIDHHGVVGIIDRGRTKEDAYFLVMDYVEGSDLDAWSASLDRGVQNQRRIVAVFIAVATAMQSAHARGIVHRDLKPSNIRITTGDQPCVIDFGLALLTDSDGRTQQRRHDITLTGDIVGSIPWSSPEQAGGGRAISAASDVYSLGVMLYQILLGRFPYAVDGPLHQTTRNICEVAPTIPSRNYRAPFGPLPPSLSAIILQCLAKKPSERFDSAGSLATALQSHIDGKYRSATGRHFRKNGLLAISALTVFGFIAWQTPQGPSDPSSVPAVALPMIDSQIGMKCVRVPAGVFSMGSPRSEAEHDQSEERRSVTIDRAFDLGITEVTRGQYRSVMGALPSGVLDGSDELPVDRVSWTEANRFCERLTQREGRRFRLPTESEWEYACRAGSQTPFSGSNQLADVAWFKGNSGGRLHRVASKSANRWGIYDMEGNVQEWTGSEFALKPTTTASNTISTSSTVAKALRGGNAFDPAEECRSAARTGALSSFSASGVGFRVAADIQMRSDTK